MVLRIEDLDPRAQDREVSRLLMDDLHWLGLDWDEGPYFQSERGELYSEAIKRLGEQGLTYPCFCTRSELHAATAPHASDGTYVYQGTCRNLSPEEVARKARLRPPATRLRVPSDEDPAGIISFDDEVYGHDLLGSAARQIYLQRLLGFEEPNYAHVPLLIDPDGRRLSKRDHDLDLGVIRDGGFSSRRVVGFLASLVGLAEKGEEVSADELVPRFSWNTLRNHRDDIVMKHGGFPPSKDVPRIRDGERLRNFPTRKTGL